MTKGKLIFSIVLCLMVFITTVCTTQSPLAAQGNDTNEKRENGSSIELISQSPWVGKDQNFEIKFKVTSDRDLESLDIAITIYNKVTSRSGFFSSSDINTPKWSRAILRHRASEIIKEGSTATISLPVSDKSDARYYLDTDGVYPVTVSLLPSGSNENPYASLTTHIVYFPNVSDPIPLRVCLVLPLAITPPTNTSEELVTTQDLEHALQFTQVIQESEQTPLSIVVEGSVVTGLGSMQDPLGSTALDELQQALALPNKRLIASTMSAMAPEYYTNEFGDQAKTSFFDSRTVIEKRIGLVEQGAWVSPAKLNSEQLKMATSLGFNRAVIPEESLIIPERPTTLERPVEIQDNRSSSKMQALQADSALSDYVSSGSVLDAYRFIADLAMLWNDYPIQTRVVAAMPTRGWNANPEFFSILQTAAETMPLIKIVDLDNAFSSDINAPKISKPAVVDNYKKQPFPTNEVKKANEIYERSASMIPTNEIPARKLQTIFAYSTDEDINAEQRQAWADRLKLFQSDLLEHIEMPKTRSLRITARSGEIPITIQNNNDFPVNVQITLTSNNLDFPDGNSRTATIQRQQITERFLIDTKAPGTFPVEVSVSEPGGKSPLLTSKVIIHSTKSSFTGTVMSICAIAVLIGWWIHSFFMSRKKRKKLKAINTQETDNPDVN